MLRYILFLSFIFTSSLAHAGGSGGNIGGVSVALDRGEVFSVREDRQIDLLGQDYLFSLANDASESSTSATELLIIDRANSYSLQSGGLPYGFAIDKVAGTVDFNGEVLSFEELIEETKAAEE